MIAIAPRRLRAGRWVVAVAAATAMAALAVGCGGASDASDDDGDTETTDDALRVPAPIAHEQRRLVFHDDFSTLRMSPDGGGDHAWYNGLSQWGLAAAPAWAIRTTRSTLHLHWMEAMESPPIWTTSITSLSRDYAHGRAWRFGYFEARMRWNVSTGAWPAFWLFSTAINREAGGRGCEIDVFEGQAATPHTYYGTVHDWRAGTSIMNPNHAAKVDVDFERFHTYAVHWTERRITWYLDDREIISYPTPTICKSDSLFMILGAQEGVGWTYGNTAGVARNEELHLDVDWVRVWQ